MARRTVRRPRLTYVHPIVSIVGAAVYVTMMIGHWLETGTTALSTDSEFLPFRMILYGTMIAAGFSRYRIYHPAGLPGYGRWLLSTPWTSDDPLPLGPPTLAWQDLLLCAAAFLADHFHLHESGATPLLLFLLAYYAFGTFLFFTTGAIPHALILLAAIPPILIFLSDTRFMLAGIAALYVVYYLGTRASLRKFPWKLAESRATFAAADWPFSRIGPIELNDLVPIPVAFLAAAFVAWEIFCVASLADLPPGRDFEFTARFAVIMVALFIAAIRLATYHRNCVAPISLFGRIFTGRLIMPRYDQVYIAPFAILLVGSLLAAIIPMTVPIPVMWGIDAFGILFVAMAAPPSLYRWRLTGAFRIVRPPMSAQRPQQKSFRISFESPKSDRA